MGEFIISSKVIEEIASRTKIYTENNLDDTLLDFIKQFQKRIHVYPTLREMSRGLQYLYPEKNYSHWVANRALKRLEQKGKITYILSDNESKRRSYARLIINE